MTTAPRFALFALVLVSACSKKSEPAKSDDTSAAAKTVDQTAAPAAPPAAPAPAALPCDGPELETLAKDLDTAGGVGVDFSGSDAKATVEAAIAKIKGKRVAFKSCVFTSQGNDEVSFAAKKDGHEITCRMAGGEAGNRDFRNAAMGFDQDKLRLDVVGVAASNGNANVERYILTDCTITPHE